MFFLNAYSPFVWRAHELAGGCSWATRSPLAHMGIKFPCASFLLNVAFNFFRGSDGFNNGHSACEKGL